MSKQFCYSIGFPIKHSLSPVMHNTTYKKLGIDDQFTFEAKEVHPDDLEKTVTSELRQDHVRGFSVTVPHKIAVMPFLDDIDPLAKKIGAVNTVVNDGGKLSGFNTDAEGVVGPLKYRLRNLRRRNVLVLGAGGAARAAAVAMSEEGAPVTIANRTVEKAQELASQIENAKAISIDSLEDVSDYNVIFNATSVGMDGSSSPLPNATFNRHQVVFDAVYGAGLTPLLQKAETDGAHIIRGIEMLATQAVGQIKRYTGHDVEAQDILKILERNV